MKTRFKKQMKSLKTRSLKYDSVDDKRPKKNIKYKNKGSNYVRYFNYDRAHTDY